MPIQGLYPPFLIDVEASEVTSTVVVEGITASFEALLSFQATIDIIRDFSTGPNAGSNTVSDCGVTYQDVCVKRGDTRTLRLTILDSAGDPVDLTGATVKLAVNPSEEPSDTSEQLFVMTGVLTDAVNGIVDFTPSIAQATQVPEVYYYDVQVDFPGGTRATVIEGKWTVEPDITEAGASV